MKSNNVVEINGKLYDARTGAPLHKPQSAQKPALKAAPVPATKAVRRQPKSIDGFSKPAHTNRTKPALSQTPQKAKPKVSAARSAAKSAPLKAKRSTTLNRRTVQAPRITTSTPVQPAVEEKPVSSSALKQNDAQRLKRAQAVSKSTVISRFGGQTSSASSKNNGAAASVTSAEKPRKPEKPLSAKEKLVKKAIESASVPQKATPVKAAKRNRSKKSHTAHYLSTAFAALLLAGYVAYLNVPSISMKVAAHRAGFAATLPAYKPAGYSLKGPIAYSPGQVTLNFASNTDERKFSLSQQPTTWDSTALLENLVAKETSNYLTYQDRGLTIYIFDDSNAAWVNGGKLYQVKGDNSRLDTDQLLRLATSV